MPIIGNPILLGSSGGGGGILTGTAPPASGTGSDGDFYVQTAKDGILASDKSSYINTGITQNARFKVEIVTALLAAVSSSYDTFFGCRSGNAGRFTARFADAANGALSVHKSATPSSSYATGNTGLTKSSCLNTYKKITVLDFSAVNGYVKSALAATNSSDFPYPIFLFANNNAGSPGDYAKSAVKTWKMWDQDGELVQYLVPADHGGTACMYDLVTDSYFTNSGAGSFTYTDLGTTRDAILWRKSGGSWGIVHVYDDPL